MQGYHELVGAEGGEHNSKVIQARLIEFINHKKKQGTRSQSIGSQLSALRHFYWINEIDGIKWDRVRAFLGEATKSVEDKAYSHEQIAKILTFTDHRLNVVVLTQSSSAMRIGAIVGLKWGDLEYIERHQLYSFKVYRGTPAQYLTFCTPECAKAIQDYMNYRANLGEEITPQSPFIRERFSKENADKPRPAALKTLQSTIRKAFVRAGVRTYEKGGGPHKRKENMLTHGLRKFARRQMRKSGMDPIITEYLLGHMSGDMKMGVSKLMLTYDPSEDSELLSEYLKAVDYLTISNEARERFAAEKARKEKSELEEKYEARIVYLENSIAERKVIDSDLPDSAKIEKA